MTGRALVDLGPRHRAPRHQAIAHRLEIPWREALEPPQRRELALRDREVFDVDGVAVVFPVHRDRRRQADRSDARHRRQALGDAFVGARGLLRVGDDAFRHVEAEGLDVRGLRESRLHLAHAHERPNHQPGDDHQYQGERDLRDDQRVSRAHAGPGRRSTIGLPPLTPRSLACRTSRRQTRPNITPLSTEMPSVNSSTFRSMPISSTRGSWTGAICCSTPMAAWANATARRRPPAPTGRFP